MIGISTCTFYRYTNRRFILMLGFILQKLPYVIKVYFIFGTIVKLRPTFKGLIFVQLNLANIKLFLVVNICRNLMGECGRG